MIQLLLGLVVELGQAVRVAAIARLAEAAIAKIEDLLRRLRDCWERYQQGDEASAPT
jgi:hypothetical protein